MKYIQLPKEKITIVDDDIYDFLNQFKWHTDFKDHVGRTVGGRKNRKNIWMHRLIINAPKDRLVDHINGNALDNRRENLRLCDNQKNIANQKIHKNNTSGYKGVTFFKATKKYHAKIQVNYKCIHLGYFKDKIEAAQAYNEAAKKYFGKFARLNQI